LRLLRSPSVENKKLTAAQTQRAIEQLGHRDILVREQATQMLVDAGEDVLPTLQGVKTKDVEVRLRLGRIREGIALRTAAYKEVDFLPLGEIRADGSLVAHPNGTHWLLVQGGRADPKISVGNIESGLLRVQQTVSVADAPNLLAFAPDGRLFSGNRNGTVSLFTLADK
jgi:hypothetical protein